jgi:hypothetical protein
MKKILVFCSLFLVCGCGINVNYIYKTDKIPKPIAKKKCSSFGLIITGDSIPGLVGVVREDVEKYFGRPLGVVIKQDVLAGDIEATIIDFQNQYPYAQLLFVVKQSEPVIQRTHEKISRKEYAPGGGKKTVQYEVYRTTFSVECDILLYDMSTNELLAESMEVFSQDRQNKEADIFPSHTLFGGIEDGLDFLEDLSSAGGNPETDLEKYPSIEKLNADLLRDYFVTYLEDLNKK